MRQLEVVSTVGILRFTPQRFVQSALFYSVKVFEPSTDLRPPDAALTITIYLSPDAALKS